MADADQCLRQAKSLPTVEATKIGNDDDDDDNVVNDAVEGDGRVRHGILLTLFVRHYG